MDGNNTFTAVAQDAYGRTDTNTVSVYMPVSTSFSFDLNGNMRSDGRRYFEYDDENQLAAVTVSNAWRSQSVYDGKMRRRVRIECSWNGGGWTTNQVVYYIYDGNLVVQERYFNPRMLTLKPQLVTYTRGLDLSGSLEGAGGIGGLLARSEISNFESPHSYYHADGNGNITALVNANEALVAKYVYDPYGNIIAASGPLADANLYRFSSKELHVNSGLVYYLYRYYEPNVQRWLYRDPLGEVGYEMLRDPIAPYLGSINFYRFVLNCPLMFFDSWGLKRDCAAEASQEFDACWDCEYNIFPPVIKALQRAIDAAQRGGRGGVVKKITAVALVYVLRNAEIAALVGATGYATSCALRAQAVFRECEIANRLDGSEPAPPNEAPPWAY